MATSFIFDSLFEAQSYSLSNDKVKRHIQSRLSGFLFKLKQVEFYLGNIFRDLGVFKHSTNTRLRK